MWEKCHGVDPRDYHNAPKWFLEQNGISHFQYPDRDIDIPVLLKTNRFYRPERYSHCKKTKGASSETACKPPYLDHPRIFKNSEHRVIYYVYHTYEPFDVVKEAVSKWAKENEVNAYVLPNSWYNHECTLVALCSENDIIVGLDDPPMHFVEVWHSGSMKVYKARRKQEMEKDNRMDPSCELDVLGQRIKCKLAELSQAYRFVASSHFRIIAEIAGKYSELSDEICVSEEEMQKMKSELEAARQALSLAEKFKNLPERLVDKNGI